MADETVIEQVKESDSSIAQSVFAFDEPEPVTEKATEDSTEETPGETESEETTEKDKSEPAETSENIQKDVTETAEEGKETEETKEEIPGDLSELAKEIDPDSSLTKSEDIVSLAKKTVKELKETIESYEKGNKAIYDTFEQMPEVSDFMKAIINGMDPKVAAGIYISETLAPEEGEKGIESYKEEVKKRTEAQKAKQKALDDYKENWKESEKTQAKFMEEAKIEKTVMDTYLTEFDKDLKALGEGKVTKSLLDTVVKAKTYNDMVKQYEKKIKDAEEKGYLRGRNEKIVQKKNTVTDGMPVISGSSGKDKIKSEPDVFDNILSHRRRI